MGRGIAQVSAMGGYDVVLFDINHSMVEVAKKAIEKNVTKAVELGKISQEEKDKSLKNIQFTNSIADAALLLSIRTVKSLQRCVQMAC